MEGTKTRRNFYRTFFILVFESSELEKSKNRVVISILRFTLFGPRGGGGVAFKVPLLKSWITVQAMTVREYIWLIQNFASKMADPPLSYL